MNPPAPPAQAMSDQERQQATRVGQAMNLSVAYASLRGASTAAEAIEIADGAVEEFLAWINTVQARHAFTGSVQQQPQLTHPQSSASPAPAAPAPAAPAAPAPSGGPSIPNRGGGGDWKARKAEENWRQFMADPTQWEDVRANKRSPTGPDYRHKTEMDGKYKKAVWISEAPAFAHEQLRQWGVIS